MIGSVGKRSEALGQLTLDEDRGPIGRSMADVEIHVVDLDVAQVVGHDLGHLSRASGHDPLPVPEVIVECIPRRFEETEALRQVAAELVCGAARAKIRGQVRVVPVRVELSDLAGSRTPEDQNMGLELVRDVRDDMRPRIAGQQARRTKVVIGQRREADEQQSMASTASLDSVDGLHRANGTSARSLSSSSPGATKEMPATVGALKPSLGYGHVCRLCD